MGYRAYSQFFIGTPLFNVVQEMSKNKIVDVKDYTGERIIGSKQVITKYYLFNNREYLDFFDVEKAIKEQGLELFYTTSEDDENVFVGIGSSTSYKHNVITTYLDKLQNDIEKIKPILEKLGYIGEVGIYSILFESY